MKIIKYAVIGLLLAAGVSAKAQTNTADTVSRILQPLFSASQWTLAVGYGHSISGVGRNLAFGDVVYNFNQNVAVVGGVEDLWRKGGENQFAVVKGGITLKAQIKPFQWTGISWLENREANPWAGLLLSNPKGNNNVGTLTLVGADFDLFQKGQFSFSVDGFYENRSGQQEWDGNYLGGFLAASRNKYKFQVGYGNLGSPDVATSSGFQAKISRSF